ncbi:MAG: orotidine-5'-phosphate decarboxylase [Candidatus Levyibacteriota bacterium]|nr:MAG: orotidine-5'-phosphate decarboxylase [Candidatus Levybacteria bacterium]
MTIKTKFQEKLDKATKKNNSLLCVGLDTDLEKLPQHLKAEKEPIFTFNKSIINATADVVCAYKLNIAFYEAYGLDSLKQLKKTIEYLHFSFGHIPIILDAKRADVPNTAKMYAKAMFEYWDADAVTILPFLGKDSVEPFFEYKDKSPIIIIKTSNKDASTFENIHTAEEVKKWMFPNIALFVGATDPEALKNVRTLFPKSPILTAGIGAQGASIEKAVTAGIDKNGNNLICNSSREIIYAGKDADFVEKACQKACEMRNIINSYR